MEPHSTPVIDIGLKPGTRYRHHRFSKDILADVKSLKTDNWHGILYIVKDYAVIAFFIWLTLTVSYWFYPLALLMIGAHQRGISTILHDSAHGVLAKNRTLNFVLGTFPTAWAIFQRHFAYKQSHVLTHHPYLGRADKDPDLEFFIEEGVFTPRSDRAFVIHEILLPMIGSKTWAYLGYLVKNRWKLLIDRLKGIETTGEHRVQPPRTHQDAVRMRFDRIGFAVFWMSILALSIIQGWFVHLVLFWVVPYLTSFHILGWFIEMSEHCSCTEDRELNVQMARNRKSRHIEKWLTGINNDHFHLDHHLDPTTPFWRLPEAHAIRMRDPVYAAHDRETGGLFQTGPNGEPSIISVLRAQNRARYLALQGTDGGGPARPLAPEPTGPLAASAAA
jgi:dihydrorhizobitoxine desaturase